MDSVAVAAAAPWISPNLSDGLGNRLFQVAAAMGAAEKYGRQLVFFLPRCYKASHCDVELLWKLFPSIPILEYETAEWHEIHETGFATFTDLPAIVPDQGGIVLRGFRQSPLYFPLSGEIAIDLSGALGVDECRRLEALFGTEPSAFLHIRLGDYLILPHHHIDLYAYWQQSIQEIQDRETIRLCLFSDSPDQVDLDSFRSFGYKDIVLFQEAGPLQTLYLMSLCDSGCICANSTFSWWGAYLSRSRMRGAPICMPSRWGSGLDAPDIYPSWAKRM
jgi:hypothetical protein